MKSRSNNIVWKLLLASGLALLFFGSDSIWNQDSAAKANGSASELTNSTSDESVNLVSMDTKFDTVKKVPIATIEVGQRVPAHNPEVSAAERLSWVEPDWRQYVKLELVMDKPDGTVLEIDLIRSQQWVYEQIDFLATAGVEESQPRAALEIAKTVQSNLTNRIAEGTLATEAFVDSAWPEMLAAAGLPEVDERRQSKVLFVDMDLHELGIKGPAYVLDVEQGPQIPSGPGQVVTATFRHANADVIDLTVADRKDHNETIGTTSNHPFWSVDRQDYIQAGKLEIGEQLQTFAGDTKRLIAKSPRVGNHTVYNFEVHDEHVYYVGNDGILVHNMAKYIEPNSVTFTASKNFGKQSHGGRAKQFLEALTGNKIPHKLKSAEGQSAVLRGWEQQIANGTLQPKGKFFDPARPNQVFDVFEGEGFSLLSIDGALNSVQKTTFDMIQRLRPFTGN